jgi:hypothetical protein
MIKPFIHKVRNGPDHHKKRWTLALTFGAMFMIVGFWALTLKYELDVTPKEERAAKKEHESPFAVFKTMFQNAKQSASVIRGVETYKAEEEKDLVPLEVVSETSPE